MTHQEIKELAGHREVPPWVMKLVADAVAMERQECAEICDRFQARDVGMQPAECAGAIRARGEA